MSARQFPIMVRKGQHGPARVPWSIAEQAYAVFSAMPGCGSQSLERLAERGGFHADEMDECLPNWREMA